MPQLPPQPFLVTVTLRAPGAVPISAAADVVGLLATDGPWSQVRVSAVGEGLELHLLLVGRDAGTAAAAAVDGLRLLLGLDAGFARWVLDARRLQVEELPT